MEHQPHILLVEDTATMQVLYVSILERNGHSADCAGSLEEARDLLTKRSYPMILLDLALPDGDGLDLLADVLGARPETKVIVVTANGSMNKAIEAMRCGAFDFLVKPFRADKLIASVDRASEALQFLADPLDAGASRRATQEGFVGSSESIRALRNRITDLSRTPASLFMCGEAGLDKDFFAGLLHRNSPYARGPLVEVDCSTVGLSDHDASLFAHAVPQVAAFRDGSPMAISETLEGGTLILKEVCALEMSHQLELLRFLQLLGREPATSDAASPATFRIISTSTRDPLTEVRAGRFRQDLLSMLYVVPLTIPPLRERKEDILPCAEHFLRLLAMRRDRPVPELSPATRDLLVQYHWPRNLRQLQAALETAVSFYAPEVIEPHMLGDEILQSEGARDDAAAETGGHSIAADLAVDNLVGLSLSEVEQRLIEATIDRCKGSVPKAAEILNVAPSTLYRKRESWQNSPID